MVKKYDENPQFLNMVVTETAANTFTSAEVNTPVVKYLDEGKALVMEILKIFWELQNPELINNNRSMVRSAITTIVQTAMPNISDSTVIMRHVKGIECIDTGATDGTITAKRDANPKELDLSDGMGNGVLVGSSKLFICLQGENQTVVKNSRVKILYRLKKVNAQELLGIIQD